MLIDFDATVFALADTVAKQRDADPKCSPREVEAVSQFLLDIHNKMPTHLRVPFRVLTLIFDGWSYFRMGKPFHRLDPTRRIEQIKEWRCSRLEPCRRFVEFYTSLIAFGLYSELYGHDYEHAVSNSTGIDA